MVSSNGGVEETVDMVVTGSSVSSAGGLSQCQVTVPVEVDKTTEVTTTGDRAFVCRSMEGHS